MAKAVFCLFQRSSNWSWLIIVTMLGFIGPSYGQSGGAAKAAPRVNVQADLDALIKAAKAEGEVTFYSAATDNVAKRVADAFSAKYGIKAPYVRISSTGLQQRYANEAEAGNFAVDMVFFAGGVVAFANEGIKKGWVESVSQAGLPVLKSGEFPAKFNKGPTAIIQIAPWGLPYNTDKVKGADLPKDWADLVNPKWKGQIILTNPSTSDAYLDFWAIIKDKYGESFFTQLRAQVPRQTADGPQATQALAAGEGAFAPPHVPGQLQGPKDKGAPLNMLIPAYTTGVEMQVMLTARAKAKHPNAGRLMANYLMTEEGNKVFNDDPGGFTVYDTSLMPKDYQPTKPENSARRQEFVKLLGF